MRQINCQLNSLRFRWPWLSIFLALAMANTSFAADALYENDALVEYPGTVEFPPQIDATNFVNNSYFIIELIALSGNNTPYYETSDTINYTNNGVMEFDPSIQLDTYSTTTYLESMAGSFYNPGLLFAESNSVVIVTNIISPGTIEVTGDGLIQLTGQYIDLTRGDLDVEAPANGFNGTVVGTGNFGIDTNLDWNPANDLGPNFATSSDVTPAPSSPFLSLGNSSPYFDLATTNNGTNEIIRSAFVEDFSSPSVPFNVYYDTGDFSGGGAVTIEWVGVYTNYATGAPGTNYLYLNDNYLLGVATNLAITGNPGYPDNFTFVETSVRQTPGVLTPAGFNNTIPFPNITFSNKYSYVEASLASSTTATNAGPENFTGSPTNLPGRIQINASKELNLNFTTLSEPNYISLISTNQFDGNAGSIIQSPFF